MQLHEQPELPSKILGMIIMVVPFRSGFRCYFKSLKDDLDTQYREQHGKKRPSPTTYCRIPLNTVRGMSAHSEQQTQKRVANVLRADPKLQSHFKLWFSKHVDTKHVCTKCEFHIDKILPDMLAIIN